MLWCQEQTLLSILVEWREKFSGGDTNVFRLYRIRRGVAFAWLYLDFGCILVYFCQRTARLILPEIPAK